LISLSVSASDVGNKKLTDSTAEAVIETGMSKKGKEIWRIRNLTSRTIYCVIVDVDSYYQQAFKARAGKNSKWYLPPPSDEYVWWCE